MCLPALAESAVTRSIRTLLRIRFVSFLLVCGLRWSRRLSTVPFYKQLKGGLLESGAVCLQDWLLEVRSHSIEKEGYGNPS